MVARPNPDKNLREEYIQMLEENEARREERDIMRHEKKSMFLRPSEVSASVARTSPPTRQPMKKSEAGSPVITGLAHSKHHSDMMEELVGLSQAHEVFSRVHMLLLVLQDSAAPASCCWVQCHGGCASEKTVMKVC